MVAGTGVPAEAVVRGQRICSEGRTEPSAFADGLDMGGRGTFDQSTWKVDLPFPKMRRRKLGAGRWAMEARWASQWRVRQAGRSLRLQFLGGGRAGQIHLGVAGGEELWTGRGGEGGCHLETWGQPGERGPGVKRRPGFRGGSDR